MKKQNNNSDKKEKNNSDKEGKKKDNSDRKTGIEQQPLKEKKNQCGTMKEKKRNEKKEFKLRKKDIYYYLILRNDKRIICL